MSMIVSKLASAIYNDLKGGLAGFPANENISLEQLEDEVVLTRLKVIKTYSKLNLLPRKDLLTALNCIPIDCKSLDKCCNSADNYSKPMAHFEVPLLLNDYGEEAIEFIGSTDKSISFKVYTSRNFKFHKYKRYRSNKPYVYIDTTPNENNMYDGYIFNAPLLERLSVIAIFKDPRQVLEFQCCGYSEADNLNFIAQEVKDLILSKYASYYRQLHPQPIDILLNNNNEVPK